MEKAHPPVLRGERICREMNTKILEDVAATSKHRGWMLLQRCRRKEYDSRLDHDAICTRIYQTHQVDHEAERYIRMVAVVTLPSFSCSRLTTASIFRII